MLIYQVWHYLIILLLINERSNAVKGILIITLSYLLINNIKIKEKFFVTIIFLSTIFSIIYFNDKVNQRFYNEIKKMKLDNNKVSEYIKKSNYNTLDRKLYIMLNNGYKPTVRTIFYIKFISTTTDNC